MHANGREWKRACFGLMAGVVLACAMVSAHAADRGPLAGGYATASATNEEVVAAANFAVKTQAESLKKSAPTSALSLVSIEHAEQQVVAGMNFKMTLNVKHDGKSRQAGAVVWWQAWNREAPFKLTSWTWK